MGGPSCKTEGSPCEAGGWPGRGTGSGDERDGPLRDPPADEHAPHHLLWPAAAPLLCRGPTHRLPAPPPAAVPAGRGGAEQRVGVGRPRVLAREDETGVPAVAVK